MPGAMEHLASMIAPTVRVVLNAGRAHVEFLIVEAFPWDTAPRNRFPDREGHVVNAVVSGRVASLGVAGRRRGRPGSIPTWIG